ncbi:MAG: serine/threonine-protein kinase [Acidobacteriota bacterium]
MKRCPLCGEDYSDTTRFCVRDGHDFSTAPMEAPTAKFPAMPDAPSDPLVGRVLAGRFRVTKKIGQGGMGAVYRGEHVKMNRPTAIKILSPELARNAEFVARFEREAEMAARIDHPNAVKIYDFGEAEDGIVYLAMEFLEGEPLSAIITREGALPLDRVVRIARQSAEALHSAHRLGIIHRDFKPDNVIVCRKQDQEDWVEVLDFGIAKEIAVDTEKQALTRTGFVLGTPQYMSPEQVKGEPLDPRSDLYSLAIVCYEMLTGALPFGGDSPQSQMVKRILEPPIPMRQARPHLWLPPAVEGVIMRGLALNPQHRFSTTSEFAVALEQAARSTQPQPLPHQPTAPWGAPPPGPFQTPPHSARPTPHTPQRPTPVMAPGGQPPFQPAPFQPQGPYPQPYPPPYYPPQKSKTGLIVLVIVIVLLALMGSCLMLMAVSDNM